MGGALECLLLTMGIPSKNLAASLIELNFDAYGGELADGNEIILETRDKVDVLHSGPTAIG